MKAAAQLSKLFQLSSKKPCADAIYAGGRPPSREERGVRRVKREKRNADAKNCGLAP